MCLNCSKPRPVKVVINHYFLSLKQHLQCRFSIVILAVLLYICEAELNMMLVILSVDSIYFCCLKCSQLSYIYEARLMIAGLSPISYVSSARQDLWPENRTAHSVLLPQASSWHRKRSSKDRCAAAITLVFTLWAHAVADTRLSLCLPIDVIFMTQGDCSRRRGLFGKGNYEFYWAEQSPAVDF